MTGLEILIVAMVLDAVVGEPRALWSRVPHPAVLMGRAVDQLDQRLNKRSWRRLSGALAVLVLVAGAALAGLILQAFGGFVSVVVVAVLLAQRSLVDHVTDVGRALRKSVMAGRSAVSMIVSRDTAAMDESAVARAAIESAAENFSDGVLAPAFWYLVAGLPGVLIYKIVNTADSMIGYRNERYEAFGKAAARLDDVLNWIPARITAALIALIGGEMAQWRAIVADARLHRSPNAGWPEAALARALGLAISGPRIYDGQLRDFAWVNADGRKALRPMDIDASVAMLWKSWATVLLILIACSLLI